jgi:hypothetical protein
MSAQIAITKKQLNSLMKGKTVTVKNVGELNIQLDFITKSKASTLLRNIRNGKGTRINLNMLTNYTLVTGGKLNIGKALNKLGKDAKNGVFEVNHALKSNPIASAMVKEGAAQIANIGLTALGTATGNPIMGKVAGSMASQGVKAGLASEGYGIKPKMSASERMAYARSCRKSAVGGSFKELGKGIKGGSMVPL